MIRKKLDCLKSNLQEVQFTPAGKTPNVYLRAAAVGGIVFLAVTLLPILAKWMLVGRWREARSAPGASVLPLLAGQDADPEQSAVPLIIGTPLYALYLRALGAKSAACPDPHKHVPVCTDLITIGSRTVIRKDVHLTGLRPSQGRSGPAGCAWAETSLSGRSPFWTSAPPWAMARSWATRRHCTPADRPGRRPIPRFPRGANSCRHHRSLAVRVSGPDVRLLLLQLLKVLGIYLPLAFGGLIRCSPMRRSCARSSTPARSPWSALVLLDALAVGHARVRRADGGPLLVSTLPRLLSLAVRPDGPPALRRAIRLLHRRSPG